MIDTLRTTTAPRRWLLAFALAALTPASALADPPSNVGRLAYTEGPVSFSPAGEDAWVKANVNRPLVTGDRLWADADGRVEIQFPGATTRLGASTSVVLANLADNITQLQVTQGTVQVRVRAIASGSQVEIDTPNLAFVTTRPGTYRIDVEPDGSATSVVVRSGGGDVYGDGNAYQLASGQSVRFFGSDLRDSEAYALAPPDAFERWAQSRDARYDRLASSRYVAPDVVGYEDLDAYGSWRAVADVGNVWVPRQVPAGWAPYRDGHWTWIDPWGWTWVDDQPWGFAPFHYGRWTQVDDRWGWVPGPVRQRAVYAPALVAFIGGSNFAITASTGPAVGWFPLAPGEVYVPGYTVSRDYFTRVNVTNTVVNTTIVTNVYTNRDRPSEQRFRFRERPAAITAVPQATFAQAQPVRRAVIPVTAQVLNKAEVVPLAKIAPQRESVTGPAPAARAAPAASMQKPVVAKAPPPPAPVSFEEKLPALRNAPGKPLDRPAADTARSAPPPGQARGAAPATPQARVLTAATPQPMPAKPLQAPGRGRDRTGAGAGAGTPPAAATPGAPPGAPSAASPGDKAPTAPPGRNAAERSDARGQAAPLAPTEAPRAPPVPGPDAAARPPQGGPPARAAPPATAPAAPPGAAPAAPPPPSPAAPPRLPREQASPGTSPPQEAARGRAEPQRAEPRSRPAPPSEPARSPAAQAPDAPRPSAPPAREAPTPQREAQPQREARPQREAAPPRQEAPRDAPVARPPTASSPPPAPPPQAQRPQPQAKTPQPVQPPQAVQPPQQVPPPAAPRPAESVKAAPPPQAEPQRGNGNANDGNGKGKGKGRDKDNDNN